jgi:hypothetical protein
MTEITGTVQGNRRFAFPDIILPVSQLSLWCEQSSSNLIASKSDAA